MNSPCMNCPERHFKCHAECEKYKEYVVAWQEFKKEEKMRSEINHCHMKRRSDDLYNRYGRYEYVRTKRKRR